VISPLLAAISLAASTQTIDGKWAAEVTHAFDVGRTEQAKRMIASALAQGVAERQVERQLARLDLVEGRDQVALSRYRLLLQTAPMDASLLLSAALAATRVGEDQDALAFGQRAAQLPESGWEVFNILGVLADRRLDWMAADAAYAEASRRAPRSAAVWNNLGWSRLIRGDWLRAERAFAQAAQLSPGERIILNNLELARAALAEDLPQRHTGESQNEYAARLNDAGVAARSLGQEGRATAAFTRALEARSLWFDRAYNNLQQGSTKSR
jgi:Flp pilus assembly protein TadD